jgi:hypothetical protein
VAEGERGDGDSLNPKAEGRRATEFNHKERKERREEIKWGVFFALLAFFRGYFPFGFRISFGLPPSAFGLLNSTVK